MDHLTYEKLLSACGSGIAALRCRRTLQPVGGQGDKVMPPTHLGGKYATEERVAGGRRVKCVLLDSVQSQANRLEDALSKAIAAGLVELPLLVARIEGEDDITTLNAPHRIADAIFRDCELEGVRFRESALGRSLFGARASAATVLFEKAPTALLFGMWDSTSLAKDGRLKIARALVSEIVGLDAEGGVRSASRIDPLGITKLEGLTIYRTADGGWTFDEKSALKKKGKLEALKPAELNHGNIPPAVTETTPKGVQIPGGVTMERAEQTVVLSLAQLRQLSFPLGDGTVTAARDNAGRAALAALGLLAVELQWRNDLCLRSRCQLQAQGPAVWEMVHTADGRIEPVDLSGDGALTLYRAAVNGAAAQGLNWKNERIELTPSQNLKELIAKSRAAALAADEKE